MMTTALKVLLKRIMGKRVFVCLKTVRQNMRYFRDSVCGNCGHIKCNNDFKVYSISGKHVFFGYYDLKQNNKESNKLLVHVLEKNARPGKTAVTIAYVDKTDDSFHEIATSSAWSWQQGARLRWSEISSDKIYFNNFGKEGYCCEKWDISGQLIERYPQALYDISPDETFGISVNFSRIQRLRPGYGYSNEKDKTITDNFPVDDGITYVDLSTRRTNLIVSLKELAERNAIGKKNQGYINHVSIGPDSRKFMFFFLWAENDFLPWKNCLYLYDLSENNLKKLEENIVVSHYCWASDDELIVTSITGEYYFYDVKTGERKKIENRYLIKDGHPTCIGGKHILTDTYPLKNNFQHVFITDFTGETCKELIEIYSDPRMFDEKRCDTHPRYNEKNNNITIDSTFSCDVRKVVELVVPG